MENEDYNAFESGGLFKIENRLEHENENERENEEYFMKKTNESNYTGEGEEEDEDNQENLNFENIYSSEFAVFSDLKKLCLDNDNNENKNNNENDDECCVEKLNPNQCVSSGSSSSSHVMMLECIQSPNKKDRIYREEKERKQVEVEDKNGNILTGKISLGINSRFYGSCESKEKGTDGEIDDDSDDDNNNNNNNNNNDNKQSFSPARTRLSTVHLAGSTGTGYTVKAGTVSITNAGSSCISACIDEIDNYYYEENPEQKRIEMKKLKEAHHPYVLQENILDEKVCAEILGRAGTVAGRESVGRFSVQSPHRGAGISGTGTGYGEGMGDDDDNIEWIGASDISYNDDNNNENNENNNNNNKKENENKNNKESIEDVEKEKEKENENEWMRIKLNTKMQSMNNNRNKNNICENNENDIDIECSTENDCLVLNNNTDNDESNNVTEDNDNDNFEFNGEGCSFGRSVTHCFKN